MPANVTMPTAPVESVSWKTSQPLPSISAQRAAAASTVL